MLRKGAEKLGFKDPENKVKERMKALKEAKSRLPSMHQPKRSRVFKMVFELLMLSKVEIPK